MSTWRQKREMDALKAKDPVAYERSDAPSTPFATSLMATRRLIAAREKAQAALGKFDDGLSELRTEFLKNPEKMQSLQTAFATGMVESSEEEEEDDDAMDHQEEAHAEAVHEEEEEEDEDDEYEARMRARRNRSSASSSVSTVCC
jgi:hypothetical protein